MPTDYRSLYGKEWLGSWDLQDKDVTVTIISCAGGELTAAGGRKSKKPVLTIKGTEKKLALNATNGKTIAALYGKHVEAWAGKRVTLYKSTTRSPDGGDDVECVRIRPKVPPVKGATETDKEFADAASADVPMGGAA